MTRADYPMGPMIAYGLLECGIHGFWIGHRIRRGNPTQTRPLYSNQAWEDWDRMTRVAHPRGYWYIRDSVGPSPPPVEPMVTNDSDTQGFLRRYFTS